MSSGRAHSYSYQTTNGGFCFVYGNVDTMDVSDVCGAQPCWSARPGESTVATAGNGFASAECHIRLGGGGGGGGGGGIVAGGGH